MKADKGEKKANLHPQTPSCKEFQKGVKEVKAYQYSIGILPQNRSIPVHISLFYVENSFRSALIVRLLKKGNGIRCA